MSFFTDNEDLRFYVDRGIDWAPLVDAVEMGHRAPGAFPSAGEAVVFYREILELVGEMGQFADRVTGPTRRRDLLGPTVARVFDAVPVMKAAPIASIATTAGVKVEAVAGALAALAVQGLVEQGNSGWRMSRLGRDERRSDAPRAELPLGWW